MHNAEVTRGILVSSSKEYSKGVLVVKLMTNGNVRVQRESQDISVGSINETCNSW